MNFTRFAKRNLFVKRAQWKKKLPALVFQLHGQIFHQFTSGEGKTIPAPLKTIVARDFTIFPVGWHGRSTPPRFTRDL